MFMIADRIKSLRETHNLTQSALAKRLGLTRAGVNEWEMGISVPSTQYIRELALLFHVSSDYLLGLEGMSTLDISGLTEEDKDILIQLVNHFRNKNSK